jgi:type II secretory pathway pseudopilin PulG
MRRARCPSSPLPEAGFALVEVIVSALLIVIVGAAVLGLMTSSTRSAYQNRVRSQQ